MYRRSHLIKLLILSCFLLCACVCAFSRLFSFSFSSHVECLNRLMIVRATRHASLPPPPPVPPTRARARAYRTREDIAAEITSFVVMPNGMLSPFTQYLNLCAQKSVFLAQKHFLETFNKYCNKTFHSSVISYSSELHCRHLSFQSMYSLRRRQRLFIFIFL